MEFVYANHTNLASVLMGKNIQFPWRGQSDVVIVVPFSEWLHFVKEHCLTLQNRKPLNYKTMLDSNDEGRYIRHFYYDISWALYSELACSSNVGKDATMILPYFDGGRNVTIEELEGILKSITETDEHMSRSSLEVATKNYFNMMYNVSHYGIVDVKSLSAWNTLIYKMCVFLQSRSSNKVITEKLNIDWRIS